jgi:hypothetical protein
MYQEKEKSLESSLKTMHAAPIIPASSPSEEGIIFTESNRSL